MTDRKPWEEYSHLWKTEAQFWAYLRGGLRRALWEKSPIKLEYKNRACSKPPEGYTGRAKSGAYCYLSGKWEGKSKLEVDHIVGNVSLRSWEDVLPFILHLIPPEGSMALVTKEAHKCKSYAEKHGMTFKEAVVEKDTIAICKGDEKTWLIDRGITPGKNAEIRRNQVRTELLKETNTSSSEGGVNED